MRYFRMPVLWLVTLMFISFATSAQAETSIAVVDVQKLLTDSKGAKSVQKQVQKRRDTFLDKLSKQEQELRQTEQELVKEQATLSAEEFAKKKTAFEEKFRDTRQMAQKEKKDLDEATIKAMSKLEDELYKVVQEIADEKGYDLVLSRQYVVIGEKSIDITSEAMKQLNDAISDIKLK